MPAMAQHIGFEQKDYRAIGVYDRWEDSPFRDGHRHHNEPRSSGQHQR